MLVFVLLPLLLGQLIQWRFRTLVTPGVRRRASICGQLAVVTIVFMSFRQRLCHRSGGELAITGDDVFCLRGVSFLLTGACLVLAPAAHHFVWGVRSPLRPDLCESENPGLWSAADCPVLRRAPADGADFAAYVVYHPLQLLLAGWLAPRLSRRLLKEPIRLRR